MRSFLISIILLTCIISFCVLSACFVSNRVTHTELLLEKALMLQNQKQSEQAARQVKTAAEYWNKSQVYFGTILQHDEVDSVGEEMARLEAYARSEDQDDFLSNCAGLLAKLHHIREMEWPFIFNIL